MKATAVDRENATRIRIILFMRCIISQKNRQSKQKVAINSVRFPNRTVLQG